jgi:multimeric flavodoxin WrbA
MKALILDGSRNGENDFVDVESAFKLELKRVDWQIETIELRKLNISPCTGCFGCWIKTPGICVINDDAIDVTRKIVQSDLLVLLTPVIFGGYSSELKKALDRSIGIMLPYFTKIQGKIHHKKRYKIYPRLIAIGMLPDSDPDQKRIFKTLFARNVINAHAPGYGVLVLVRNSDKKLIKKEIKTVLSNAGVIT